MSVSPFPPEVIAAFKAMSKPVPKVLNKHKNYISCLDVYIGRGSKWGNPFPIVACVTREEVIEKYKAWFPTSGLSSQISELRGKNLVCFCAPKACHGDVLLELANA